MRVATWRGETRFTLDDVPEPVPNVGSAKRFLSTPRVGPAGAPIRRRRLSGVVGG